MRLPDSICRALVLKYHTRHHHHNSIDTFHSHQWHCNVVLLPNVISVTSTHGFCRLWTVLTWLLVTDTHGVRGIISNHVPGVCSPPSLWRDVLLLGVVRRRFFTSACCTRTTAALLSRRQLATVLSELDRWPIIRVLLIHIERQQHEVLMWQRSNLFTESVDQPPATSSASQELNAAVLARCKTYVVQSSKILHPKLFHLGCCKAHDLHLHAWARYHQVHPYTHPSQINELNETL